MYRTSVTFCTTALRSASIDCVMGAAFAVNAAMSAFTRWLPSVPFWKKDEFPMRDGP